MCNYFSCIVTRKLEALWLKTSSSHEDIIEQFKLDDSKLEDRDFVRVEIRPDNPARLTRDKKDWTLYVDEMDTLPDWFTKAQSQAEAKCWSAWKQSVALQLVLGQEERILKDVGIGYAYDSAKVVVYGNVIIEAYDNATIRAYGNAKVIAYGNANVRAHGNVTVEAYDNVAVEAYYNATVEAHDNVTVRAHDNVTVRASDNAAVEAYDNVTIDAYYKATIEAYNNATVEAYYKATIRAHGNVTVEAHDNVAVEAYDNVTVRAHGSANKVQILSSTATVIYRGKVYVRQDAQVQQVVEGEFLAANYTPL